MGLEFLDDCLALRELPMEEVQDRLAISEEHIDQNANYEHLSGLTELRNPDVHPGFFYYREGEFVLLYVGEANELYQMDVNELESRLGHPEAMLRSRAGKLFSHHVYPDQGIAFSTDGEDIFILEIFLPASLVEYKTKFYIDPGPFTR